MVAVAIMPAVMASCEKDEPTNVNPPSNTDPEPDEPEEDQFEDLYGFWINSDNTGAMEFTKSGSNCNVRYYAHAEDGLKSKSSILYSVGTGFDALDTDGRHTEVKIISNSKNRIVLEKTGAYNTTVDLSSYSFSRATENEFYDFLEGGNDEPNGSDENLNPEGKVPSSNDYGVDLGLSVYWADYNVGSTENTEIGGCYGWGDVTGTYYTEDETMYPNVNPPSDISGTEYDIASYKWGNGWRIPTKEEMEELIDNCDITWQNWCKCWEFTSKINGNSIKLPYASVRDGKSTFYDECGYWTSTLDKTYMAAYALYTLKSGSDMDNINHFKRSYGFQIRPVKDKTNIDEPDEAEKLIGSWKYNDYGDEFILTFYSNGNAREECYMDGDFTYSENGTYKYSNGKITEWSIIDEGSAFAQTFSDVPWTVKFISSTKMTLTGSGKYADTITLTKQ